MLNFKKSYDKINDHHDPKLNEKNSIQTTDLKKTSDFC